MARYSVSGTLSPDATTADTGEPAGTYNTENYWAWGVYFLYKYTFKTVSHWVISQALGSTIVNPCWYRSFNDGIVGEYTASGGNTGTATVAEVVPPSLSARLMLVIESANGQPIQSPCMIPLSEIQT